MYPQHVSDDLLQTIAASPRICPYVDMPLQHASDRILQAMNRGRSGGALRELIARIRAAIPGVALRSSFIVGFPGETEDDFAELLHFVEEVGFDRLGVFRYSQEDGTQAADLARQVPEATKEMRRRRLMGLQARISREKNEALVGSTLPVLVCGTNGSGRRWGRTPSQAPEIDGVTFLANAASAEVGEMIPARISRARTYDLEAVAVDLPAQTPHHPR
jgi:ribosomal protein S12 methylthiotransferase